MSMGTGPRRRVLGVVGRGWGAWRRGLGSSPHAGRGSGSRGSRSSDSQHLSRRSCLHSGGPASLRGVWGSARRSDLARGPPRLSLPRWGLDGRGPRKNGAGFHYGGLGDHSPGGPPRPRRRWWRPAFEEVGRIWVGPRPRRGATLLLSVNFVVSLGRLAFPEHRDPLGFVAAGLCLSGRADVPSSHSQPRPLQVDTPLWLLSATLLPVPRNCSQARLPKPLDLPRERLPLRRARVRSRNPDVPIAPGALPWEPLGVPSAGPRPYPPSAGVRGAASSCGHPGRGWARAPQRVLSAPGGRAAAGKRGGGKEGAGAVWAAGVFPAPHRRGRGRRGVK